MLDLFVFILMFLGPFIVVAFLGYQRTKSNALSVILLVAAVLLTALSTVIYTGVGSTDGQRGMGIALVAVVQWFITVLAIIAFVIITSVLKRKGKIECKK